MARQNRPPGGGEIVLRPAAPAEAAALSALAIESKAHWGYDAAFMEMRRAEMCTSPQDIARQTVVVEILEGRRMGERAATSEVPALSGARPEPAAGE